MTAAAISDLRSKLSLWRGSGAQVWDYSVSHGVLRIKLQRPGADSCAVLMLKNCERVSFTAWWDGFDPTIETAEDFDGERVLVRDADRLNVDCGAAFLSEPMDSYASIPPLRWDFEQ
jgi:hypothetical protein